MESVPGRLEYHPLLAPRRGEFFAWLSTGLAVSIWLIMLYNQQAEFFLAPFLVSALALAAAMISLGNWVDRHTVLALDEQGVAFENGLRRVRLEWPQIQEVRVIPANWGRRVQVSGESTYFIFRMLAEVNWLGKTQGRIGFEQGDEILRQIVLNSELQIRDHTGEGYTYIRR